MSFLRVNQIKKILYLKSKLMFPVCRPDNHLTNIHYRNLNKFSLEVELRPLICVSNNACQIVLKVSFNFYFHATVFCRKSL